MFKRTLYLFVGILLAISSGSVSIYPIYTYYIKNLYNYSLREINLFGSFINIGCWVAFGMGIIYDTLGPRFSNFLGYIFLPVCLLILYRLIESTYTSINLFWFLLLAFIMGQGSALLYTSALTTCIKNFSKKNSSNLVGLIISNCAISPSIFASFKEAFDTMTIPNFIIYVWFHITIIIILSFCLFDVIKDNKNYEFKEKIYRENKQAFIIGLFSTVNFFAIVVFLITLVINNIFGILLPAFMIFPVIHLILLIFVIMEKCHQFDQYLEDKYDQSHGNFEANNFTFNYNFPPDNQVPDNGNDENNKNDNVLDVKKSINDDINENDKLNEKKYPESENRAKFNKLDIDFDEKNKKNKKEKKEYSQDIKMSRNMLKNYDDNDNNNKDNENINNIGEYNQNEEGRYSNNENNGRFSSNINVQENNLNIDNNNNNNEENKENENNKSINNEENNINNDNEKNENNNKSENEIESSNLSGDEDENGENKKEKEEKEGKEEKSFKEDKEENGEEKNENSNFNDNEKDYDNINNNLDEEKKDDSNKKMNKKEEQINNNRISYPKFSLNSNNNQNNDNNQENYDNYPKFSITSENNDISNNNNQKFSISKDNNNNDNNDHNNNTNENNNDKNNNDYNEDENNNIKNENNNIDNSNLDNGKNGKNDDLQINNNKINNNARKFTNSKKDNSEFKTSANQILNTSQNMNTTQNSLMNPNLSPFDINYNYHLEENEDEDVNHNKCVVLLSLFRKPQILKFFFVLILTMGSMISNVNNIKFIVSSISSNHSLSSTSLDKYPLIYFSFNSIARIFAGASINSLMGTEYTFIALISITLMGFWSQLFGIFMTKFTIYISISMAGATHGSLMTFVPLYCRYYYNVNDLGTVLGFLTTGNAFGSIIIATLIFPHFYHKYSEYDKIIGEYCSGKRCFRKSYLINCLFMIIASLLAYWIFKEDKKKKIKERLERENMYKTIAFCSSNPRVSAASDNSSQSNN